MPVAALASLRREQSLPHGLRDFLADLHSAGAAVDFSVLYPVGRLVDAPLPTWTHRTAAVHPRARTAPRTAASPSPCIRCSARMCGCRRSPSGTPGRPTSVPPRCPWLGDHQVHDVAALPGAAYCEMALAAARHGARRRRPKSATSASSSCCCSMTRPRSPPSRRSRRPASSAFAVETDEDGERVRARGRGPARGAVEDGRPPRAGDIATLLAAHPSTLSGDEIRQSLGDARHPIRSGLHRSGRACTPRRDGATRARRGRAARLDPARSRPPTASTPRCWMPASSPSAHTLLAGAGDRRPAAAAGRAPAARLRRRPRCPLLLRHGSPRPTRPRSRRTSMCSTRTATCCSTVQRPADGHAALRKRASVTGCSPTGC